MFPIGVMSVFVPKVTLLLVVVYESVVQNLLWQIFRWIYLSFRSCDSCRRVPEPKHHSFLFNHWSAAEDFFRPKNSTASAGCEPANLGTKGQHATSRPPKPLKNSSYSFDRRLDKTQSRSGRFGGEEISFTGNRSPDRAVRRLITVVIELFWLW